MARNNRNHNHGRLRSCRTYTTAELCKEFGVHPRTIQGWHKKGLNPIHPSSRSFIFLGQTVKDFLKAAKAKRRVKLNPNEFYCPRCKLAQKALPGSFEIIQTTKALGKGGAIQIILKALCCLCQCKMRRLSSSNQHQSTQQPCGLLRHESPCLNTDIEKETKL